METKKGPPRRATPCFQLDFSGEGLRPPWGKEISLGPCVRRVGFDFQPPHVFRRLRDAEGFFLLASRKGKAVLHVESNVSAVPGVRVYGNPFDLNLNLNLNDDRLAWHRFMGRAAPVGAAGCDSLRVRHVVPALHQLANLILATLAHRER